MFRWYCAAKICYALLSDVDSYQFSSAESDSNSKTFQSGHNQLEQHLRQSRWFSRGWTLQELIAPKRVRFYDRMWRVLGEKAQLIDILSEITRIDAEVLRDRTYIDR